MKTTARKHRFLKSCRHIAGAIILALVLNTSICIAISLWVPFSSAGLCEVNTEFKEPNRAVETWRTFGSEMLYAGISVDWAKQHGMPIYVRSSGSKKWSTLWNSSYQHNVTFRDFGVIDIDGIVFEEGRGWPCLCVSYTCIAGEGVARSGLALGGPPRKLDFGNAGTLTCGFGKVIPYKPIWRGLCINVLVFATTCTTFRLVWICCRQRMRWSRGLCVACGYNISTLRSNRCPECGKECSNI